MLDDVYAVLETRDARFDGWVYVGVVTTGVYCRPSCPAVMPKRENMCFHPSSAAAQEAGYRACKRCRPDASPGSPEWNVRADVVGRAMRLIADGLVDREGVTGLAARLGYSERQLHRQLVAGAGAGAQALARAQRAKNARTLLETTDLPAGEVAFAAGFASIRQFNDTLRRVYAMTPTGLRAARPARGDAIVPGLVSVRLAYRAPLDAAGLFRFLARRAVPGIEEGGDHFYRRSLNLPHGRGVVTLRHGPTMAFVGCELHLEDLKDVPAAVQRCRRLLDLDADPHEIADHLGRDPLLTPLVAAGPGRRLPGHVDAAEHAVLAVLGQRTGLGVARTLATRLVERYGEPLSAPVGAVTHAFPRMDTLAEATPEDPVVVPAARLRAVLGLARALAADEIRLGPETDRDDAERRLLAMPGITPETVAGIRMRALGDPDVFLPADAGVRRAMRLLGEAEEQVVAPDLVRRWRPWRSYVVQHLWAVRAEAPTRPSAPAAL
ncbi:AlkA N-terminal domain-containing protein [Streptosporangium soli]|nr:helix-turn-helix domain-containing protein [Streptosporangium sp. KLBMP 9127]